MKPRPFFRRLSLSHRARGRDYIAPHDEGERENVQSHMGTGTGMEGDRTGISGDTRSPSHPAMKRRSSSKLHSFTCSRRKSSQVLDPNTQTYEVAVAR